MSADKPVLVDPSLRATVVANSRRSSCRDHPRQHEPPGGIHQPLAGSKSRTAASTTPPPTALLGACRRSRPTTPAMIQQGQTLYLQNGYTTAVEGRATRKTWPRHRGRRRRPLKLDVMIYADLASAGRPLRSHKRRAQVLQEPPAPGRRVVALDGVAETATPG